MSLTPNEKTILKAKLIARDKINKADEPCYYVAQDWHDPPVGSLCWVFHRTHHYVSKGRIIGKNPAPNNDYVDTWYILILSADSNFTYMLGLQEECNRFQIHPTRKIAYTALYGYIEEKILQKEREIKNLEAKLRQITPFMKRSA